MKLFIVLFRLFAVSSLVGLVSLTFLVPVLAAHPEKFIKMIVHRTHGGASDLIARAYSKHLSERLCQPISIDSSHLSMELLMV